MIRNPILRGFNPDPSIIRVGADYYIATSTFEWFPGVQIHHSRDLENWELITHPLNRLSQLNMIGVPDSCGVWAPCLSYDQGVFYLVYSNVKSFDGVWKDTPNYLVTANDIHGPWSEPVFLSASGFDGSLFHDDDGQKWFVSMIVDHRKGKFFGGIILQEYDPEQERLVGPVHPIFEGTELGITEGPHLYKKDGYYYLITAEGGTEYGHAVTMARSRALTGPYEVHPDNPIFTARDKIEAPFQRCGHADFVQRENGEWIMVFLASRPLPSNRRCILGRETVLEQVEWRSNGWLYSKSKSKTPRKELSLSVGTGHTKVELVEERTSFDVDSLSVHFQALRRPIEASWLSLSVHPGYLRLYGQESLSSLHYQSLVARRVQHFKVEVSTAIDFSPEHFQQMAGLVFYYNTIHWIYFHLMGGQEKGYSYLQIIICDNYKMTELLDEPIKVEQGKPIELKGKLQYAKLQFYYKMEDYWQSIGSEIDASILSDDYVREGGLQYRPAFTGMFAGLCCQDLSGQKLPADFKFFNYKEIQS